LLLQGFQEYKVLKRLFLVENVIHEWHPSQKKQLIATGVAHTKAIVYRRGYELIDTFEGNSNTSIRSRELMQ
jgi:hypothetical protein